MFQKKSQKPRFQHIFPTFRSFGDKGQEQQTFPGHLICEERKKNMIVFVLSRVPSPKKFANPHFDSRFDPFSPKNPAIFLRKSSFVNFLALLNPKWRQKIAKKLWWEIWKLNYDSILTQLRKQLHRTPQRVPKKVIRKYLPLNERRNNVIIVK